MNQEPVNQEPVDEAALHDTLLAAVPPMPAPPDRLAQIGLRVRRARRWAVGASALAVAVVLGAAGALGLTGVARRDQPAAPAINDCPAVLADRSTLAGEDTPGPLVPPGAVRATLCEIPHGGRDAGGSARALTRDVDRLASMFNALRARHPQASEGTSFGDSCTAVGYSHEVSFVFQYRDRPPVVVWFDRNCRTMTTTEHVRVLVDEVPSDLFATLYRAQLRATTRPADVPAPACPATNLDGSTVRDDIARNRGTRDPFLPDPLVAAAACRYATSGQAASLAGQARRRTDLAPLRSALNDATGLRTMTACGSADRGTTQPELVDILLVADATGAVAEVRVWRRPCVALFHASSGGRVPTDAVLAALDQLLGPPS